MMSFKKWLRKVFKVGETCSDPTDFALIARQISPLIDTATQNIIREYHQTLLKEPITYIVYAVWGAKADGELAPEQKSINALVLPEIKKVLDTIGLSYTGHEQKYAVEFLVRSLIISKITYSIELARNKINELNSHENDAPPPETAEFDTTEMLRSFIDQADMDWRKKFRGPEDNT